jgi:hypothetical protein
MRKARQCQSCYALPSTTMCSSARFLAAAICLSFLLPLAPHPCAAQTPSAKQPSPAAPGASTDQHQPTDLSSVQITALDTEGISGLVPETLLKSVAERLQQAGATPQGAGAAEKLILGGRDFWKMNVAVPFGGSTRYVSEIMTFDRGFALFFVLSTSDMASLGQMEQSLQSIRFLDSPKWLNSVLDSPACPPVSIAPRA